MTLRSTLRAALLGVAAVAAASTAAFAQTAPAQTASTDPKPKPTRQCFRAADVNGFTAVDDKTVNVRVGVRDVYQLVLFAPSPDIDWTQAIGLQAHGSSWICSGLDATVIVPTTIGPQRYPVTAVRKLTPDEVAALPPKQKP